MSTASSSAAKLVSRNPADGEVVWRGNAWTSTQVDAAIARARAAQREWEAVGLEARTAILEEVRRQLEATRDSMVELIAREVGKPRWEAATEVGAMVGKVALSIDAYQTRCATVTRSGAATRFRAQGVVAVLGPFNFPGHLPHGHIVPALLAGNAVLFKPSEHALAVGERLVAIYHAAGVPPEIIQFCPGGRETGEALVTQADVDGVFFTGSSGAGHAIKRATLEQPRKILALEMGGNNPLLADADVIPDLEAAASVIVQSAFVTAGQRCTCARRLIVPEGARGDALLAAVVDLTQRLRLGAWDAEPEPFLGPVVHPRAAAAVVAAQEDLLAAGGVALLLATRPDPAGAFVTPGLLDVSAVAERSDEEVFGPLLQVIRVPDFAAAMVECNATAYGLAAGYLGEDAERYTKFAGEVRVGILNWNRPLTGASGAAPFGGTGKSGNHRPGAFFAADYCAFPVASLEVDTVEPVALKGIAVTS